MSIITPAELRRLADEHSAHPADPARCRACGEPYPCRTTCALIALTVEVARRLWAEQQLRAQRQDTNQPIARLAPAPPFRGRNA